MCGHQRDDGPAQHELGQPADGAAGAAVVVESDDAVVVQKPVDDRVAVEMVVMGENGRVVGKKRQQDRRRDDVYRGKEHGDVNVGPVRAGQRGPSLAGGTNYLSARTARMGRFCSVARARFDARRAPRTDGAGRCGRVGELGCWKVGWKDVPPRQFWRTDALARVAEIFGCSCR